MANIRLSNRSAKRHIAQMRHDKNRKKIIDRTWQLLPNEESSTVKQTFSYNQTSQEFSRLDLETSLGKYANPKGKGVLAKIKKLNEIFIFSDAAIAKFIRDTLKHKIVVYEINLSSKIKSKIDKVLLVLTHLLFGIEAARSPEAFIIHQMLLDLIIEESAINTQWTWEYILSNAVASAFEEKIIIKMRKAGNDLQPYLSYPYYYPGPMKDYVPNREEFKHLYENILPNYIKKQLVIVLAWAKKRLPNNMNSSQLIEKMLESYNTWFEIPYFQECEHQKLIQYENRDANLLGAVGLFSTLPKNEQHAWEKISDKSEEPVKSPEISLYYS